MRVAMAATGVVQVAVCACFPPKVHDGTQTLRCRICSAPSKQQVARLRQRAIQMQQLGGVSILTPLSGSLN
jgi:hypothetical protein